MTKKGLPFFLVIFILFQSLSFALPSPVSAINNNFDAYHYVRPDQSLFNSARYIVVDDFNGGKFLNRKRAPWQGKGPGVGALDLSLDKQDARNPERGYSLKAEFNLMPRERAYFRSFLDRVDVSKARSLIFRIKLQLAGPEEKFSGRLTLMLTDWKHQTKGVEITRYLPQNQHGWVSIELPLSLFEGLDFDQLFSLSFRLLAQNQKLNGALWIDEVAFFGARDVAFQSQLDNIQGYPKMVWNSSRRKQLRAIKSDKKLLMEIARDTWKYFQNSRDKETGLILDHIRTGDAPLAADYTSLTNMAMDFLCIIAAEDLRFISPAEARRQIKQNIETLQKMRRYKGFYFQFYDTKKLAVTRSFISTVDSGWLAVALVIVRQTYKEFWDPVTKILDGMNFDILLDPENNQFVVGMEIPEKPAENIAHYGLLSTEARVTSFYAIGKGDVAPDHWWSLYRTPPEAWKWQRQIPKGHNVSKGALDYFQGYYEYQGKKFVPSWGGSLFEFLMPTLVLDEKTLAPKGLGLNDRIAAEIHRDYALKEKSYPVWGISPAAITNGRQWQYTEFGVRELGVRGYSDLGVVTPHVSFLALDPLPVDAIRNIRKLLNYEVYGDYGFYDSLALKDGKGNSQYLALDQGMSLAAIYNYLKQGALKKRFEQDPIFKNAAGLLNDEVFFEP